MQACPRKNKESKKEKNPLILLLNIEKKKTKRVS